MNLYTAAENTIELINDNVPITEGDAPICCQKAHLLGMCEMIKRDWSFSSKHQEKGHRWLGYVQGVLAARYDVPLEDLKNSNRTDTKRDHEDD